MTLKETQARLELFQEIKTTFDQKEYFSRVLVESCTGSGKCKIALDLYAEDLEEGERLDIIVPYLDGIITWQDEIDKWGFSRYRDQIEIYCYKSLHKHKYESNCIADEVHMLTESKLPLLKAKTYLKKLVGLSATIDYDSRIMLRFIGLNMNTTVKYTLDEGVEDEIVTPYHITVVESELNSVDPYLRLLVKGKRYKATEKVMYEYHNKKVESSFSHATTLSRMRFIYNLRSKRKNAQLILRNIPKDKKILGFCSTIKQAEALYAYTLHSKGNRDAFDLFTKPDNEVKRLGTVFKANMSINIPDLDIAFITQMLSKSVHMLQRTGRMVRKSDDPDKIGRVIALVVKETQDEVWLRQALREFDKSNITYVHINDVIHRGFNGLIKSA